MTVCLRIRCIFLICSTESQCEKAATGRTGMFGWNEVVLGERLGLDRCIACSRSLRKVADFGDVGSSITQVGARPQPRARQGCRNSV